MRKTFLIFLLLIATCFSTAWFISPTGNDVTGDGSAGNPWRSFSKAINSTVAGDNISAACGVYAEGPVALNSLYVSEAKENLTIQGNESDQTCVIVYMRSPSFPRVFDIDADNVTLRYMHLRGNGTSTNASNLINFRNGDANFFVEGMLLENVNTTSTDNVISWTYSGSNGPNNVTIRNVLIRNFGDNAIGLASGHTNNTIIDNITVVMSQNNNVCLTTNSADIVPSVNLRISNGTFLWNGTSGSTNCINLFPAVMGNGYSNISLVDLQFGNATHPFKGLAIRVRNARNLTVQNLNLSYVNNSGVSKDIIWFEFAGNEANLSNITIGGPNNYVDAGPGDFLILEDFNNTQITNSKFYVGSGNDIVFLAQTDVNNSNVRIRNVSVFSTNASLTHVVGCGSEGGSVTAPSTHNCSITDSFVSLPQNQAGAAHCLFIGGTNNSILENNTVVGCEYSSVIKLSLNPRVSGNNATNASLVSYYDKASLNAQFLNNTCTNLINGTYCTLIDGTGAVLSTNSFWRQNYFIYNGQMPYNTTAIALGTLQTNTSSDYNDFYLPTRTYNRSFKNGSTLYWHVDWIDIFGLEEHSRFFAGEINASWYDAAWEDCINITITGGFPENFTHDIILNTTNFNYSHAKTDLSDLRFLEGSCYLPNVTIGLLPSFNQSVTSNISVIKIKTFTENQTSVAMYFSNPGASPVWNVSQVAIFGDDFTSFTGQNNTDWTVYGNVTVSGGVVTLNNFSSTNCVLTSIGGCSEIRSNYNISNNTALEFSGNFPNTTKARVGLSDSSFNQVFEVTTNVFVVNQTFIQIYNSSGVTTQVPRHSNDWVWGRMEWSPSYYAYYENRTLEYSNGTFMPIIPIRPYAIETNNSIGNFKLDWFIVRTLNTTGNNYSFSGIIQQPAVSPIAIYTSLSDAFETQNSTFNIDISGSGSNFTAFSIQVSYNSTIILSNSSNINRTTTLNFTAFPIAPLVIANETMIPFLVEFNGTVDYIQGYENKSGSNNILLRFLITDYNYTIMNNYTLEANNSVRINSGQSALTGSLNISYYYNPYLCQKGHANGSVMNATCNPALLSTQALTLFDVLTNHSQEAGVLYLDTFVNRTYNLSFNLTEESRSSKQLSDQFNATREYFIWLVNSTNGTVNGASNLSNIYNVTFQDESTFSRIAIDSVIATYTVTLQDGYQKNFSITYAGLNLINESIVRAYPNFIYINISSIEVYSKTAYTTRSRFLLGANKSTFEQENVTVYLLPTASSTLAIINVVDNGEAVSGAYIQILKYYASTQTYINVDQKITNDEGRSQAFLDVDAYYKFIVFDAVGNQLYTSTQPEQFICDSSCEITLNIDTTASLDFIGPYVIANCYGVNASNSIVFNFADYTGLTHNMTFLAYRNGVSSPVCNTTIGGSSGGYTCALGAGENLSTYAYFCEVGHTASPIVIDYRGIIDQRYIQGIIDWVLVALIMLICCATLFMHPGYGALTVGIGFFSLNLMGVVRFNLETSFFILLTSMVLSYMFFRKEGG